MKVWIQAARPATLTAAAAPVLVGTAVAYAYDGFRLGPALAALLGAFLIQIGTNFANDLFDAAKGADTPDRLGPTRAVAAGLIRPRQMLHATAIAFGLAALCGLYLVVVAGWPVIAIGVASILAGILYTGGPYPLAYHGLGDLFVMIFFGFVAVCGTTYVQALEVPKLAWLLSVPVGALATAILVVNNLRDRVTDERAGKRTLAVRLGRNRAIDEYHLLLAAAYGIPALLALAGLTWLLLPTLTFPMAMKLSRQLVVLDGRELNPLLGATARLLVLHAALTALGVVLASS